MKTHANGLKSAKQLVLCSSVSLAIFSKAATAAPQGRIPWKDEDSVTEQGFLLLLVTCNYHQWSHIALTSSLLLHWRLQVCPPLCLLFHLTHFIQELSLIHNTRNAQAEKLPTMQCWRRSWCHGKWTMCPSSSRTVPSSWMGKWLGSGHFQSDKQLP